MLNVWKELKIWFKLIVKHFVKQYSTQNLFKLQIHILKNITYYKN